MTFDKNMAGVRVEFLGFGEPEPYSKMKPGAQGTIDFVDDAGTIHVVWDDGGRLGLITRPLGPRAGNGTTFRPDRYRVIA